MKIMIYSQHGSSAGLAMHLKEEGHAVGWVIKAKECQDSMMGVIEQFPNLMAGVKWDPDFAIFDYIKDGKIADDLRASGLPVWGGSEFADQLEMDRKFGTDFMNKCGILTPETVEFNSLERARSHVEKSPETYVIKMDGEVAAASSYVSRGPEDMIEYLDYLDARHLVKAGTTFILQKKMEGVEVSTEIWFSHGKPVPPYNHTFETKKFMPGDLGPNTGCETSVVVPVPNLTNLMKQTLAKCFKEMEQMKYTGHLDINCIVSEKDKKAYGLEWTPRFGYSAIYAALAMMGGDLGEMYHGLARGNLDKLPMAYGWGTALRMSIPPYPSEEKDQFKKAAEQWVKPSKDKANTWFVDVKKDEKRFLTAGGYGLIAECTGQGTNLSQAWKKSRQVFDEIQVPNKQGRYIDGIESARDRINKLRSWGFELPFAQMDMN